MTDTGITDIFGKAIMVGDIIEDEDGFSGKVVRCHGAYRYDVTDGIYLNHHSSLLAGDGKPKKFKIVG